MGRRNISNAIHEISSFNDNPFAIEEGFAIHVNNKTVYKKLPSGETFSYEIQLEASPHTKLYFSSKLKSDLEKASANANKIFNFVTLRLKHGEDIIYLPKQKFMALIKVKSLKTYYSVIAELEQMKFFKRIYQKGQKDKSTLDFYWINPLIAFRGSRKNKYDDKIKIT